MAILRVRRVVHRSAARISFDKLLDHPAEVMLGAWSIVTGVTLLLGISADPVELPDSITWMPVLLIAGIGLVIGAGSVAIILGRLICWQSMTVEWNLERSGWMCAGAGWAAYVVAIVASDNMTIITVSTGCMFIGIALLRLWGSYRDERRVRRRIVRTGA